MNPDPRLAQQNQLQLVSEVAHVEMPGLAIAREGKLFKLVQLLAPSEGDLAEGDPVVGEEDQEMVVFDPGGGTRRAPPLAPRADGHVMLHALPVLVRKPCSAS